MVSVKAVDENDFLKNLEKTKIAFCCLGKVAAKNITIDNESWGNIADWKSKYDNAIGNAMKSKIIVE